MLGCARQSMKIYGKQNPLTCKADLYLGPLNPSPIYQIVL